MSNNLLGQVVRLFLVTTLVMIIALSSSARVQAQIITPPPLENSPYDAETFKIADQLQCPVCQGVTVAYSNSGLAQQMRALIKKKLEQGENREQILQYFVERYGESILTTPPRSGFTLLVWLLPIVGLLAGVGIVGYVLRGWKRRIQQYSGYKPNLGETTAVLAETSDGLAEKFPPGAEVSRQIPVSAEVLKEYEERVELELARFVGSGWPGKSGQEDSSPNSTLTKEELS